MDGALWLKALHIMAFAAWMAGMWYLPRLLVYHARRRGRLGGVRDLQGDGAPPAQGDHHAGHGRDPAGRVRAGHDAGPVADGWLHGKLLLVLLHAGLPRHARRATCGGSRPTSGRRSARWYRVFNEVPTLLFIGIVLLAVLKPF